MLEVASIWVVYSPPAHVTQAYLPHGKSEPSWPGPVQVAGISPLYLGAVKSNITVWQKQTLLSFLICTCKKKKYK